MKVLTVDVGLKNLAICCMESNHNIILWEVYDLIRGEDENQKCLTKTKNGNTCNKKCKYKYDTQAEIIYSCRIHFPKNTPLTKKNTIKVKEVKNYLLQDIAIIVQEKIQKIYEDFPLINNADKILIELQPKLNPKMKFISHIIYGEFVRLFKNNAIIRFVSASKKLKAYKGPKITCALKGKYAQRKYLSKEYTKYLLKENYEKEQSIYWLNFLENHIKKDDLCDTYLMCINEI